MCGSKRPKEISTVPVLNVRNQFQNQLTEVNHQRGKLLESPPHKKT